MGGIPVQHTRNCGIHPERIELWYHRHLPPDPPISENDLQPVQLFYYDRRGQWPDTRVWPYLKRIIDAGVPIVFAGLPKVRTYLTRNHPDILSRLKTLILFPIVVEDFIVEYKDIQQEAIEQIYMAVKGDMRKFKEICTDCRDRAKELNYTFVDLNLALEFIADLPPQ